MTIDTNAESNILFIGAPLAQGDTDNYGFDASVFLNGDTINACTCTIKLAGTVSTDITVGTVNITNSHTVVSVALTPASINTVGKTYQVYLTFSTNGGITRTFGILVPCI